MKRNLPTDTTRLIYPTEAIVPGRGPAYKALRKEIPRVAFGALKKEMVSQSNLKVVMTGCLADNAEDIAVLAEHLRIAKYTNVPFHLVGVTRDREEHSRRLGTPARVSGGKAKLQDDGILQELLEQHRLVDVRSLPEDLLTLVDVEYLTLDTTGQTVDQTVSKKMRKAY